jgi:hypothetical protein
MTPKRKFAESPVAGTFAEIIPDEATRVAMAETYDKPDVPLSPREDGEDGGTSGSGGAVHFKGPGQWRSQAEKAQKS